MRIFEILSEKTAIPQYDTYDYGNWAIKTTTHPVKSPQTNNQLLYLATAQHKRLNNSDNYIVGSGKTEIEARDAVINQIRNKGRNDNINNYRHFTIDLNTDFVREYVSTLKYPGFFKFASHEGTPSLIMASGDFYSVYKDEMESQGFHRGHSRVSNASAYAFSATKAELKAANMTVFGRYAIMEPNEDHDGNYVFEVVFDSQTLASNDKMRMGIPGLTVSASDSKVSEISAPTIKNATMKGGEINRKTSNRILDPHNYFGNNNKKT